MSVIPYIFINSFIYIDPSTRQNMLKPSETQLKPLSSHGFIMFHYHSCFHIHKHKCPLSARGRTLRKTWLWMVKLSAHDGSLPCVPPEGVEGAASNVPKLRTVMRRRCSSIRSDCPRCVPCLMKLSHLLCYPCHSCHTSCYARRPLHWIPARSWLSLHSSFRLFHLSPDFLYVFPPLGSSHSARAVELLDGLRRKGYRVPAPANWKPRGSLMTLMTLMCHTEGGSRNLACLALHEKHSAAGPGHSCTKLSRSICSSETQHAKLQSAANTHQHHQHIPIQWVTCNSLAWTYWKYTQKDNEPITRVNSALRWAKSTASGFRSFAITRQPFLAAECTRTSQQV